VRTGALVSAAAHAALLALVLRGLPWLRPHPDHPAPVVSVSLVTAAELAAADAAVLPRGAVPAPPEPAASAPEPESESAPEPGPAPRPAPRAPEPEPDAELLGEAISLAPAFDPERPLGVPGQAVATLAPDNPTARTREPQPSSLAPAAAVRPRARPADMPAPARERGAGGADRAAAAGRPGPSADDLRAGLAAGVHAALAEAQRYPRRARDRGITGAATLALTITRDGRLVAARLVASSGAEALDAASLAAARNARYPPAPPELPGARFSFTVRLVFTP
jgi:TonB family protein